MQGGEVLKMRTSRKVYLPIYIMIFILFAAMGVVKFQGKEINNLAFKSVGVFSIAGILWAETHRMRNKYEINDNAVVHVNGLFFRTIKKTDIHALSDAQLKQNPWQMILGIGDVTANAFSEITTLKNINKPHKVISFLEEKMNKKSAASGQNTKGGRKS